MRRSRLPGETTPSEDRSEQVVVEVAPRDARVFSIGTAHLGKAVAVSANAVQGNAAHSPANEALAPQAARTRRRSRLSIDQRPGHVTHLVLVQPVLDQPRQTAERWDALHDDLQTLTPLLDDIRAAQSLSFIDQSFDLQWERLSQQALKISAHLGTHPGTKRVP